MHTATLVTSSDKQRVMDRLGEARSRWSTYAPFLDWFQTELKDATALPPNEVPGDVITMNSRFELLDLRTGKTSSYTLVYPEDESLADDHVGVLSPMGMALLGARVGDVVRWEGTNGYGAAKILRLTYQPEATGDFER